MITTILMPYLRPDNISKVIAGIRNQTVKSKIWIWDVLGEYKNIGEDVYFFCSNNFNHLPRFMLSSLVDTEYIYIQDDDFAINDITLFEKLIALSKTVPDHLIGVKGKKFDESADPEKPYQHGTCWKGEGECDVVNTGLSFFRTEIMNKIPMNHLFNPTRTITREEYLYGDDMYLSSFNKCYATELFKYCVDVLPENDRGLSHESKHMDVRNELCKRYWL